MAGGTANNGSPASAGEFYFAPKQAHYKQASPHEGTDGPGLTLAGDYTRQPYFATMEGTVVSGERAATVVARRLGL
ncbi:hypothetical protein M493_08905 [Geobacillus genomosp. 3]|uniref:Amine oxidase domain-containing protein n=1 Tax=Geobacillus genomosp. 3 TaxID=1921421 RepID=S5YZA5_GEOG3|nr:hypothetical protein M493_08905 [Geobacillus genomosp. 3]